MSKTHEPTWPDKINAIKVAANWHSDEALAHINRCLALGQSHMEYKDHRDFDCESEEQYIFQEAEHLIEQYNLPFNMALNSVVGDRVLAAEFDAELATEATTSN